MGEILFGICVVIALAAAAFWFFGASILTFLGGVLAVVISVASIALTFGTLPFWLLVVIATIFISWCVSDRGTDLNDHYDEVWSGTAITTVILFSVIIALVNYNLLGFEGYSVLWSCLMIGGAFIAYLLLGGGWSVFRNDRFGTHRMEKIEEWKQSQLRVFNALGLASEKDIAELIKAGVPDEAGIRDLYFKAIAYKRDLERMIDAARPRNNMDRIMVWIGLWPWSVVAYVLRDPVKVVFDLLLRIYEASYNRTVGRLDAQFKTVFSDSPEE